MISLLALFAILGLIFALLPIFGAFADARATEHHHQAVKDWHELEEKRRIKWNWGEWGQDRQGVARQLQKYCEIIEMEK